MQLLEHFYKLTVHPKNAEELKGLILQLAIQGKLTKKWRDENPDVESASVLLENIALEKTELIKKKTVKKEIFNSIHLSEHYFEIPRNWKWERLGNVGFIFNGNSVNKTVKETKYTNLREGFPYIGTKDVGYIFDAIDHDNGVRIPFDEPKFKVANKNTVLICSEGGSAGKKMGVTEEDCCFGNKLFAIEQYGGIESIYILSLYGSASFSEVFKENMTGIIGGISRNNFASLLIPLPPLEEQKTIVGIVDQLFKEVEELEQQTKVRIQLKEDFVTSALQQLSIGDTATEWNFLQEHFKTFFTEKAGVKKLRESILQLAVQGKLTTQWRTENPDVESATILLKKIKAEKAQLVKDKKIRKEKSLPEIVEDEIPFELPNSWKWFRFQNAIIDIEAGKSPICYPQSAEDDEWGVIKMSAISWGAFNSNENKALPMGAEIFANKEIKAGDFILTRANTSELIAKSVIVQENVRSKLLLNDKTLRFRFFDSINVQYLNLYNNGSIAREHYKEVSSGTSDSMQNISRDNIKLLKLPMPPLEEQKAIVTKVNAFMGLCDKLEKEIEQNNRNIEQLMQSCLREVFEGKSLSHV